MKPTECTGYTMILQLLLIIPFIPMLNGKAVSEKDSNSPLYLKSNKSFFKLPTRQSDETLVRNKRDLDYIGTVSEYSSDEKQDILQKHLDLRGGVSPEAANMEYMYWDDDLAIMGEQWSSACLWEHGQPDNISPYSSLGQNLWLGGGTLDNAPDPVPGVQAWYNEDQYYDYETNGCSHVCGHYTQVVWANSIYVGCGRAFCDSVSDGQYTNAWIVTCNYAPAGNYVGVKPYISGSSCTQCASGIATCHTNQCRNCTQDAVSCDCNVVCNNCGTVTSECSCECQNGWYGSDCNTVCEDTHQYCGQNPGWPGPQYCGSHPAVPRGCPAMCGVCEAATGDEICNEGTDAPDAPSTNPPGTNPPGTNAPATDGPKTNALGTGEPGSLAPTTVVTDPQVCGGMSQECLNGGTFKESTCKCKCTSEYQGDQCENSKEEAKHGVMILIIDSIANHGTLSDLLLGLLATHLTTYCNVNIDTCCGKPGKSPKTRDYSFLSKANVAIGMGYPQEHETRSDAYWTMIIVTVPTQTDLCSNGTSGNDRKKRDLSLIKTVVRTRRETDASMMLILEDSSHWVNVFNGCCTDFFCKICKDPGFYLPQDILLEVMEDNLDNITAELAVTIDSVERGTVEETSGGGGLETWAIILIVIFLVVIIIVVPVIVLFKGSKPHKNQVDRASASTGSSAALSTIDPNNNSYILKSYLSKDNDANNNKEDNTGAQSNPPIFS